MRTRKPTLEDIVNSAATIYSLPVIHDRLSQAINNPRSSFSDITAIISEDQGLSFRILKMANSPMFGYHKNIDTITKAATIIGTQQLRDLSLAISVMGVFKDIPEEMITMKSFWKHSITCGIVARAIATCRREANVERFFVTGMLHDVGQLILCTSIPAQMEAFIKESRQSSQPHFIVQRDGLGFDHGDVGGCLLKKWKIPLIISEPVACHHAPTQAMMHPMETALLHVADVIAHALQAGCSLESFVIPLDESAWKLLDIPVNMLSTILKQTDTLLGEIMGTLFGETPA